MNNALMFSTGRDNWTTPQDLFDRLNEEFQFTLDAAAEKHNAKCAKYYGPDHSDPWMRNALVIPWPGRVWCNPPYSKARDFVAKAVEEMAKDHNTMTMMLLAARTDTRMFHDYLYDRESGQWRPGIEVRFLKGRLKFGGAVNSAPFPSMLVVFRG